MTATRPAPRPSLARNVALLPSPLRPLHGRRATPLALPDNIICFRRSLATDLNRPQRGRALHHRFVLILSLATAATVRMDDRNICLHAGEGLLVFPFQFHDYIEPERAELNWLFVTFELLEADAMLPLRFHPFAITPVIEQLAADLITAYLTPGEAELTTLLLALLLTRVRQSKSTLRQNQKPQGASELVSRVNQLALRTGELLSAKEIARSLGISVSHVRARFRASCGVSLGRHLRRLRLEKARGLLRLSRSRVFEVAEQCGYASIYSFSRAFRVAYGISPLGYRHGKRARHLAR